MSVKFFASECCKREQSCSFWRIVATSKILMLIAIRICRYVSLRLDGRVRGSGVGIPSWQAMSRQLPPTKGIWGGALDGMDGRV